MRSSVDVRRGEQGVSEKDERPMAPQLVPDVPFPSSVDGLYHSLDPTIAAVGYDDGERWPCGTRLRVCARTFLARGDVSAELVPGEYSLLQTLRCLNVSRVDTCPGCSAGHIDLSEAGLWHLCGWRCDRAEVTIEQID